MEKKIKSNKNTGATVKIMNTSYMKVYRDILDLPKITQEAYDDIIKNYRVQKSRK